MLSLTITNKSPIAEDVLELTLAMPNGDPLPGFSAGSHIDLHLRDDLVRQYSLTNPADEPNSYCVAVAKDANSRGGSAYIHDKLKIGQTLQVSAPRNHFPLNENARKHVFLAGGIGVTPVLAMIRRCNAIGQEWQLIYATRNKGRCAYHDELAGCGSNVHFHFDDRVGGPLDIPAILPKHQIGTHMYCCGPEQLMHAVQDATSDWPKGHVHFEWFSTDSDSQNRENQAFEVVLNNSGKRLTVPDDKSLLQILRDNGVPIASVCSEGVCGTCETYVISGEIDHRDKVLTDEEKESNEMMMVCCSRGYGELVLDL